MPEETVLTSDTDSTQSDGGTQPAGDAGKADAKGDTTATTKEETKPEAKAETKVDTTKTERPVVPEKYDLKLPEKSPLTPVELEATSALAKDLKLSQEQAQRLVDIRHQDRVDLLQGQQQFFDEQVDAWVGAVQKDEEISGKDGTLYRDNVARAKQVINRYGSPELVKALNQTRLGNHPELVRMMVRIGKAMREDSFEGGEGAGTRTRTGDPYQNAADKLYGKPKGK